MEESPPFPVNYFFPPRRYDELESESDRRQRELAEAMETIRRLEEQLEEARVSENEEDWKTKNIIFMSFMGQQQRKVFGLSESSQGFEILPKDEEQDFLW